MTETFCNEVAIRSRIPDMVEAYNKAIEEIRAGFALINTGQERLHAAFASDPTESSRHGNFDVGGAGIRAGIQEAETQCKRQAWRKIIERLQLRNIMSKARLEELDEQIEGRTKRHGIKIQELPEITVENLMAMLESNLNNRGQYLEEKVHEVYNWLRPTNRRGYVTNEKFLEAGIGRRLIMGYIVQRAFGGGGFEVNYHRREDMLHLDQVFHLLDGKPMPDSHNGELINAIREQTRRYKLDDNRNEIPIEGASDTFETPYFRGRCFANNNLHLEFKRKDLLDLFNLVAGGMRLQDVKKEKVKK